MVKHDNSNDPEEVIVEGDTVRNSGTVIDTDVTPKEGVLYSNFDPSLLTVRTWFGWPRVVRLVPPGEIGMVEQSIVRDPESVTGFGETEMNGVDVERETDLTEGSGFVYVKLVPSVLTDKIWFGLPIFVIPVPPEVIGIGFDDNEISNEPEDVIADGDTERNSGTVIDTDVTVPVPKPSTQPNCSGSVETTDKTWPFDPTAVIPVPPEDIGNGLWL